MRLRQLLEACWWRRQHPWLAILLAPLAAVHGLLLHLRALAYSSGILRTERLPVPVVVVGNVVVGGAGKTPTTIALVEGLRAQGWTPGIVSRGYGGSGGGVRPVTAGDDPRSCGDEPQLLRRRTGAPVWIGRDRAAAARGLCAAHPQVDVVVSDDGLQHLRLHRDAQVIVFDGRGIGNGHLLPAGPLRQPLAAAPQARSVVVYNAPGATARWPGHATHRRLGAPVALAAWWRGERAGAGWCWPEQDAPFPAAAGIAEPERFFRMLEEAGLRIERLPLPDHAPWHSVPWRPGKGWVLVTEKDAVKLPPTHADADRIHVVPLDFVLPVAVLNHVLELLRDRPPPGP